MLQFIGDEMPQFMSDDRQWHDMSLQGVRIITVWNRVHWNVLRIWLKTIILNTHVFMAYDSIQIGYKILQDQTLKYV